MQLIFLGSGAGCGVPSFFCGCIACQEAAADPHAWRSRCSLLVRGEQATLIDAPPELRTQLIRERVSDIDHFILTHAHYDHIGGLGDLEFYVRVGRQAAIPAYMTSETQSRLHTAFDFMEDCLYTQAVAAGWQWDLDGVRYTALDVTHTPGTIGLLVETDHGRTAYLPDTGPLPAATMKQIHGIDTLILGATFWGRNWMPEDHLSVDEAVQIARQARPGRLLLTHISMHHDTPVTNRELESYLASIDHSFHLAYDGMCIEI